MPPLDWLLGESVQNHIRAEGVLGRFELAANRISADTCSSNASRTSCLSTGRFARCARQNVLSARFLLPLGGLLLATVRGPHQGGFPEARLAFARPVFLGLLLQTVPNSPPPNGKPLLRPLPEAHRGPWLRVMMPGRGKTKAIFAQPLEKV